jgi:hypothetical protein
MSTRRGSLIVCDLCGDVLVHLTPHKGLQLAWWSGGWHRDAGKAWLIVWSKPRRAEMPGRSPVPRSWDLPIKQRCRNGHLQTIGDAADFHRFP